MLKKLLVYYMLTDKNIIFICIMIIEYQTTAFARCFAVRIKKSLLIAALVYALSVPCFAEEEQQMITSGEWQYYINDEGTAVISSYSEYDHELIDIPREIDGILVTAIGEYAVSYQEKMISVTIPDSITIIEKESFSGCKNLKNIIVAPGNENYEVIDGVLFDKKQKALICYPEGLSENKYTVPEGTIKIEKHAFGECENLISIEIPESTTDIVGNQFWGCRNMNHIVISPENEVYAALNNVLFEKESKTLISYPRGIVDAEYSVPLGIVNIGESAFYNCDSLKKVVIPTTVTEIGGGAFVNCTGLTKIEIPDSVRRIGSCAFQGCNGLTTVIIPDYLEKIEGSLFLGCHRLTNINIPDSVVDIEEGAFIACVSLTSIEIPKSVLNIGDTAFWNCPNITMIVEKDSYASEYAKINNINYEYTDAYDWLYK